MSNSTKSNEWDEKEKDTPLYEIDFVGDHIHEILNGKCQKCGKTADEIIKKELERIG